MTLGMSSHSLASRRTCKEHVSKQCNHLGPNSAKCGQPVSMQNKTLIRLARSNERILKPHPSLVGRFPNTRAREYANPEVTEVEPSIFHQPVEKESAAKKLQGWIPCFDCFKVGLSQRVFAGFCNHKQNPGGRTFRNPHWGLRVKRHAQAVVKLQLRQWREEGGAGNLLQLVGGDDQRGHHAWDLGVGPLFLED